MLQSTQEVLELVLFQLEQILMFYTIISSRYDAFLKTHIITKLTGSQIKAIQGFNPMAIRSGLEYDTSSR